MTTTNWFLNKTLFEIMQIKNNSTGDCKFYHEVELLDRI
jgi:hypothetical protein